MRGDRRWVLSLLAAVLSIGGAACGSDGAEGSSATSIDTSAAPERTTTNAAPATTIAAPATTTGVSQLVTSSLLPDVAGRVDHPNGASFAVPDGWEVVGAVVATEFSTGAECQSGRIIDETLVEGAPGPSLYQAVFQLCARPADGAGLGDFMDRTYGQDRAGFRRTVVADREAYLSDQGLTTLIFVANEESIFQIVMSVDTDPDVEEMRIQQVREVLDSLTIR